MKTFRNVYKKDKETGTNKDYVFLCSVGVNDVKLDIMKPSSEQSDGEIGLVPAPMTEDNENFLGADGKWSLPIIDETPFLKKAYPVNSIYITVSNVDPSTILGFGTWALIGSGKTLVGVDENNQNFNTPRKLGGSNYVSLTTNQIPAHVHSTPSHSHTVPNHSHTIPGINFYSSTNGSHSHAVRYENKLAAGDSRRNVVSSGGEEANNIFGDEGAGQHTHEVIYDSYNTTLSGSCTSGSGGGGNTGSAGVGKAHSNIAPYYTCYFWERTA